MNPNETIVAGAELERLRQCEVDLNALRADTDVLAKRMTEMLVKRATTFGTSAVERALYRKIDKKALLGAMMEVMVAEAKNKLELLQGCTALAKSLAEEKRATESGFTHADTSGTLEMWYFTGGEGRLYPTKMAAEIAARAAFPDESEAGRYARIYFQRFTRDS